MVWRRLSCNSPPDMTQVRSRPGSAFSNGKRTPTDASDWSFRRAGERSYCRPTRSISLNPIAVTMASRPSPSSRGKSKAAAGKRSRCADFKLSRGREVLLRVVDGARKPLGGARIDVRDPNRLSNSPPGRSDSEGRYKVVGLAPAHDTVVDIIDQQQSLGATIEIPGCAGWRKRRRARGSA